VADTPEGEEILENPEAVVSQKSESENSPDSADAKNESDMPSNTPYAT